MGGGANDEGNSIFVDSAGYVYTTGSFEGTVDFFNLTSPGTTGIFISKLDSSGNLVWAKGIGGNLYDDAGFGIYVDTTGNVYTTGYFGGTVDFDPGGGSFPLISEGSSDIFIIKLDRDGNFVWARAMGGNNADYGYGIFVDSSGNVYTAGYFQSTLNFNQDDVGPATVIATSLGVEDIFISKLNSDGSFSWVKTIGGTGADMGYGISLYSNGFIYTTGSFQGTVDFDGAGPAIPIDSVNNSRDIFLNKLSLNGDVVWTKTMGGNATDMGNSIAVDPVGNVYTTGSFQDTNVDFDPGTGTYFLSSDGPAADIFITKLNSNGDFVWAKGIGGPSSDIGYGISVNSFGTVFTTGFFADTVDFDPDGVGFNLTSNGGPDIFISKLDSNGNFGWAKGFGGNVVPGESGRSIFADSSGNVYTTGYFRGTDVDFDPGTLLTETFLLSSNGFEDIFISKLAGRDRTFPWPMFLPAILNNAKP